MCECIVYSHHLWAFASNASRTTNISDQIYGFDLSYSPASTSSCCLMLYICSVAINRIIVLWFHYCLSNLMHGDDVRSCVCSSLMFVSGFFASSFGHFASNSLTPSLTLTHSHTYIHLFNYCTSTEHTIAMHNWIITFPVSHCMPCQYYSSQQQFATNTNSRQRTETSLVIHTIRILYMLIIKLLSNLCMLFSNKSYVKLCIL